MGQGTYRLLNRTQRVVINNDPKLSLFLKKRGHLYLSVNKTILIPFVSETRYQLLRDINSYLLKLYKRSSLTKDQRKLIDTIKTNNNSIHYSKRYLLKFKQDFFHTDRDHPYGYDWNFYNHNVNFHAQMIDYNKEQRTKCAEDLFRSLGGRFLDE